MLSKVENAQASPSLSSLARLAAALDVPISGFFTELDDQSIVHVKAGQGLDLVGRSTRSAHRAQLLGSSNGSGRSMEPSLVTLKKSARVSQSFRHPGTEFIYMLAGVMEYGYGPKRFLLEPGDTLQFDGEATHGPARLIETPIQFLSVKAYGDGEHPGHH